MYIYRDTVRGYEKMSREFFTIDDFDLNGKTVLLRLDLESPIDPASGKILEDSVLKRSIQSIRELSGSRIVILGHQNRPGRRDFTTLEKHAERLTALLGKRVTYTDDLFCSRARNAIKSMKEGEILLLENTTLFSEEEALTGQEPKLQARSHIVTKLYPLADFFVNDSFASSHLSFTTLTGFAEVIPCIAGRIIEKEINVFERILRGGDRPSVLVLGGSKVETSIELASYLLKKGAVDKILLTGLVANAFLIAKGIDLGEKNRDVLKRANRNYERMLERAGKLLEEYGQRFELPNDLSLNNDGNRESATLSEFPVDKLVYDIGLDTTVSFSKEIRNASLVLLSGPAGVYEVEEFALGTVELFHAVASSRGFTVLCGGYTSSLAGRLGIENKIRHISVGSEATLQYLSGKTLPVIEALKHSKKLFEGGPFKKRT